MRIKIDEGSIIRATLRNCRGKRYISLPLQLEIQTCLMRAIDLPFYFESENNGTKRNGVLRGRSSGLEENIGYLAGAGGLVLHR